MPKPLTRLQLAYLRKYGPEGLELLSSAQHAKQHMAVHERKRKAMGLPPKH